MPGRYLSITKLVIISNISLLFIVCIINGPLKIRSLQSLKGYCFKMLLNNNNHNINDLCLYL